jgi:hypothetical protein
MTPKAQRSHIEKNVAIDPDDMGCINWIGDTDHRGIPHMAIDDSDMIPVARVVWMLKNGPLPLNKRVAHACENKSCVNIAHLKLVPLRSRSGGAANY